MTSPSPTLAEYPSWYRTHHPDGASDGTRGPVPGRSRPRTRGVDGATTGLGPTERDQVARALQALRDARKAAVPGTNGTIDAPAAQGVTLAVAYAVGLLQSLGVPLASASSGLDALLPSTGSSPDAALGALEAVLVSLTAPATRGSLWNTVLAQLPHLLPGLPGGFHFP